MNPNIEQFKIESLDYKQLSNQINLISFRVGRELKKLWGHQSPNSYPYKKSMSKINELKEEMYRLEDLAEQIIYQKHNPKINMGEIK